MRSHHGYYHTEGWSPPSSAYFASGRFGRMFGNLPPFASDTPLMRQALMEIGAKGGILDAADELSAGAKALITEESFRKSNPDSSNPEMTAGMTFLGQFIDHDMTFDPTSSLERQVDPEQIANFRTPTLALDNLYGSGPRGNPHIFDQSDGQGFKFLIEETGTPGKHDLPRNSQSTALIGDPRNDENLILSQLQLAFLLFHNNVYDYVQKELGLVDPRLAFEEAQRLVRWHYQWVVVHHFLRITCGESVVEDVLKPGGRKFYQWRNEPFIPVEFSVSAYRFGHSQIRPSYRSNFTGDDNKPLFLFVFDPNSDGLKPASDDLSGSRRKPWRFIDWQTFFDFKDGEVKLNKRIDMKLSSPLFQLPHTVVPNPNAINNPQSLAQRNLLRHLTFGLPSGQRVAKAMADTLGSSANAAAGRMNGAFDDLKPFKAGLEEQTPLWLYVLREAEVLQGGSRLGPVGGRIVTEVFVGLIQGDGKSFLIQQPDWKPTLPTLEPSRQGSDFTMTDLLAFAGVGPKSGPAINSGATAPAHATCGSRSVATPSDYRTYYVVTGKPKPGKIEAAGRWWVEKGMKIFETMPGTKSVRAYITQFNLSGETFNFEIWQELESYAAFDQWDQHSRSAAPDIYVAFLTEFHQYFDIGPCRIMGEWPASRPEVGVA